MLATIVPPILKNGRSQPLGYRDREPLFAIDIEIGRQQTFSEALQKYLSLLQRCLQPVWYTLVCELYDSLIEKWRSDLKRAQHGGPVDFHKNVLWQIRSKIGSHRRAWQSAGLLN